MEHNRRPTLVSEPDVTPLGAGLFIGLAMVFGWAFANFVHSTHADDTSAYLAVALITFSTMWYVWATRTAHVR